MGVNDIVRPAVPQLIRLEAYFRANGLEELSEAVDGVLSTAEKIMQSAADDVSAADGSQAATTTTARVDGAASAPSEASWPPSEVDQDEYEASPPPLKRKAKASQVPAFETADAHADAPQQADRDQRRYSAG